MNDRTRNVITVLTLALVAFLALHMLRSFARHEVTQAHEQTYVASAPRGPRTASHTFNLMPGQAFSLPNNQFRKIEVRSDFPIRVYVGSCHSDYTVEWLCDGDPHDVFITDTRRTPLFMTPRANAVTISGREF